MRNNVFLRVAGQFLVYLQQYGTDLRVYAEFPYVFLKDL